MKMIWTAAFAVVIGLSFLGSTFAADMTPAGGTSSKQETTKTETKTETKASGTKTEKTKQQKQTEKTSGEKH